MNDSIVLRYHQHKKSDTSDNPEMKYITADAVEKIGDRYFSIIIIDLFDSTKSQFSKKVLASTTIRGNWIDFNFELLTKKRDSLTTNFIINSKYYLSTIRISNVK